jgi:hypothetical protein
MLAMLTKQQILEEIRRLSREDRVDLAMALREPGFAADAPVSAELAAELERRNAEDDGYDAPGEPADVVADRIRRGEY